MRTGVRLTRVLVLLAMAVPALRAEDRPAIEKLDWLAGCWRGTTDGAVTEELWMAPSGGVMLGLHRDVSADGEVSFEFLRIVESDGGIVYEARPSGHETTEFPLIELGENRAVFENRSHDFPKRIIYRRVSSMLRVQIDGGDDESGARRWTWSRAQCF